MQCAWLIDQDQTEYAKQILKQFKDEEFDEVMQEKDIEMVVHSLYGILEGNTEEGQQSVAKAKKLLQDFGGKYE